MVIDATTREAERALASFASGRPRRRVWSPRAARHVNLLDGAWAFCVAVLREQLEDRGLPHADRLIWHDAWAVHESSPAVAEVEFRLQPPVHGIEYVVLQRSQEPGGGATLR